MPRFNSEKWSPQTDSSPGVFHLDPERIVLLQETRLSDDQRTIIFGCPCGCGGFPDGERAIFRMGHDARLRGKLIRAHLMDVQVRFFVDGNLSDPLDAMEVAANHGWTEYLDAAVLRRDGKNRELLRKALNHPDLMKAGKWDFTGGQVVVLFKPDRKDMVPVMYVNRAGDIRKTRVPATQVEEMK